jgi:hypothetical protein
MIDEICRAGAQRMLLAALEAEVDAYVEAFAGEVDEDGKRLVVRNGHAPPEDGDDGLRSLVRSNQHG